MSRTPMLETEPYRLLGIRPGASAKEVRRAFRRQAKLYHPDRNPGDADAEERFREILSAYDMAMREVEQPARQSSPSVDPLKAHRTSPHDIPAQRHARWSRSPAMRRLISALLTGVAFALFISLLLLYYIWSSYKTDWIPGCC